MNGNAIGNMVQGIAEYEAEVLPRIYADQREWEQRMAKAFGDWHNWSLPYPLTLEVGFSCANCELPIASCFSLLKETDCIFEQ
jgi:hypothetical protein